MKKIENYKFESDGIEVPVGIYEEKDSYYYKITLPKLSKATYAYLDSLREEALKKVKLNFSDFTTYKDKEIMKKKFSEVLSKMIDEHIPNLSKEKKKLMLTLMLYDYFGLGDIEFLLSDPNLEEIVVNSSKEPIWVYHKKHGWLITNLYIPSEEKIANYASMIGRSVGRSINVLNPLLDAYLPTGERVNSTLYPITINGNTLTIRKFFERPWTIVDFIREGVMNSEMAALLWSALQYEANIMVTGGTAAGKTSMVNVLTSFLPKNQRIISIEEVRELKLPKSLHWVPLLVRLKNQEGKGEVSMLDLLVNSLRMRPDRIIVGEVRRKEEAEVLFEAMHTGHSVISTMHAETTEQLVRRLINPPIQIPKVLLESLHLVITMYRDRRTGIRRIFEISEVVPGSNEEELFNPLYKWIPSKDKFVRSSESYHLVSFLKTFTRMTDASFERDLKNRKKLIDYVVKNNINDPEKLSVFFNKYNKDPETTMAQFKKNPKVLFK